MKASKNFLAHPAPDASPPGTRVNRNREAADRSSALAASRAHETDCAVYTSVSERLRDSADEHKE
jgi:hypothetical protein